MRKLGILVTIITLGLILAACGGGTTATPPPPPQTVPPATTPPVATPPTPPQTPPAPTIDAKALYGSKCAACHGANREGVTGLGPSLRPSDHEKHTVAELAEIISKGRAGTAMPPFGGSLSTAEIDAMANFIKNVAP
ncbi:MAG: cytochrome c [Chloroflexi bacterium]|nr:cytochrome c [Chloroflexota bacterium]